MSSVGDQGPTKVAAQPAGGRASASSTSNSNAEAPQETSKDSTKKKLLGLLGKGKKQGVEDQQTDNNGSAEGSPREGTQDGIVASPKSSTPSSAPILTLGDLHARPSSPNLHSPASSLIFERNVQEATLSPDSATGIPAHIKTDDQIPPALEASSLVITDSHLAPDEVEIVTHTAHQPAAAIIAESIPSAHPSETHLPVSPQDSNHHDQAGVHAHEGDDNASTYGSLDPNDVRRLSFISFADVVHAEHAESGVPPSLHHLPTSATQADTPHAQSPTRSPLSSFSQPLPTGIMTPPISLSGQGSSKGVELSPSRSQTTSPVTQHGELAIETLGQALRKTASRDLSGFSRSPPNSAV